MLSSLFAVTAVVATPAILTADSTTIPTVIISPPNSTTPAPSTNNDPNHYPTSTNVNPNNSQPVYQNNGNTGGYGQHDNMPLNQKGQPY